MSSRLAGRQEEPRTSGATLLKNAREFKSDGSDIRVGLLSVDFAMQLVATRGV